VYRKSEYVQQLPDHQLQILIGISTGTQLQQEHMAQEWRTEGYSIGLMKPLAIGCQPVNPTAYFVLC
jgi:hypothetical protein